MRSTQRKTIFNKRTRHIFNLINKPFDFFLGILLIPSGIFTFVYRRIGSAFLPFSTRILKKLKVFPIIDQYYEPRFNYDKLIFPLDRNRELPGINLNEEYQLNFLKCLVKSEELVELKLNEPALSIKDFCMDNIMYGPGDADFLYQFIRHTKPKKVIEIGSGNSTRIARKALERNKVHDNIQSVHVCIEPYEQYWLEQLEEIIVVREKIENTKFDWHEELSSGDLLFIDSSHIIRPQGDVLQEYLNILPRLKSGVYVHIHDIFTPKDYPSRWLIDESKFWNEQYLVEALISNSNRYEVIAALNFLKNNFFDSLNRVCPYLRQNSEPGSFYIRVK